MRKSSNDELTIRNQFNRICKLALKGEAVDYHRHMVNRCDNRLMNVIEQMGRYDWNINCRAVYEIRTYGSMGEARKLFSLYPILSPVSKYLILLSSLHIPNGQN